MARVKRGTTAHKRRAHTLEETKGFRWGRKSKFRLAKDALRHAGAYAFRDRRAKKRTARGAWNAQINAAARAQGVSYSVFAAQLKKHGIALDRKILSALANQYPAAFKKILEKVSQ